MPAQRTAVVVTLTASQLEALRAVALRRGMALEALLLERWRIRALVAGARRQKA